jgi:hypothetical protein
MADPQVTASYRFGELTKTFSSSLPLLPQQPDVNTKTAYISAMRSSITEIQSQANVFLTEAMEKEKAAQGTTGSSKGKDEREEELYGEEDIEGDA